MMNFLNSTIKAISNITMPSPFIRKTKEEYQAGQTAETSGGFTSADWEKVGQDMKRGLIQFGKTR